MASAFLVYDSDNCPLPSGRVPIEEIAWAASIIGIGGLFGTVAVGWIADRVGRKNSLLAMAIPQIVSTVSVADTFEQSYDFGNVTSLIFFFFWSALHTDQLLVHHLCAKHLLLVCVTLFDWIRWRCSFCSDTDNGSRNCRRQVLNDKLNKFSFWYSFQRTAAYVQTKFRSHYMPYIQGKS